VLSLLPLGYGDAKFYSIYYSIFIIYILKKLLKRDRAYKFGIYQNKTQINKIGYIMHLPRNLYNTKLYRIYALGARAFPWNREAPDNARVPPHFSPRIDIYAFSRSDPADVYDITGQILMALIRICALSCSSPE
jgi:hypothetical protein